MGKASELCSHWPTLIRQLGFIRNGSVSLTIKNNVGYIMMSHPHRNVMASTMQLELRDAVDKCHLEKENLHAVVLHGDAANGAFCAGAAIDELKILAEHFKQEKSQEPHQPMFRYMQDTCDRVQELPCLTFSFLHGAAYGGGSGITAWTDFRIATPHPSTQIGFVHKHMGLTPPWHGGLLLRKHVGPHLALKILHSARIFHAHELFPMYITEVTESSDIPVEHYDFTKWFGKNPLHTQALKASILGDKDVSSAVCSQVFGAPANLDAIDSNLARLKNRHKGPPKIASTEADYIPLQHPLACYLEPNKAIVKRPEDE